MNPWQTIWSRPRSTVRAIVEGESRSSLLPLVVLYGTLEALTKASTRDLGASASLLELLGSSVGLGWLWGVFYLYVGAALFAGSGSWLGGQANTADLRTAIAWSWAPYILSLFLWPAAVVLFGTDLFAATGPSADTPVEDWYLLLFDFGHLVLWAWTILWLVKLIAEVQEFSIWKSLVNTIAAFALGLAGIQLAAFAFQAIMS